MSSAIEPQPVLLGRPLHYWSRAEVFKHLRVLGVPERVLRGLYGLPVESLRIAVLSCDASCLRGDVLPDGRMVRQTPWRVDMAKVAALSEKTGSRQGYKENIEKRASDKTAVFSDDAEAAP